MIRTTISIVNALLILVILILIILLLSTRYTLVAMESFVSSSSSKPPAPPVTVANPDDSLLGVSPQGKNSFPNSEAHIFYQKQDKYGIAQCTYGGYTPILTCSYDSRV
jgi:hypothetical protein